MASLPAKHPNLSLHLTDRALTPLITSAHASAQQLDALTSLSHTALSGHETASRLDLGVPQRVMVEHGGGGGPVLLQSFLSPSSSPSSASTPTPGTAGDAGTDQAATRPGTRANGADGGDTVTEDTAGGEGQGQGQGQGERERERTTHDTMSSTTTARLQRLQLQTQEELTAGARVGDDDYSGDAEEEEGVNTPPMLVGVVVAPSADEALDARRAAAKLERVGRVVQARWADPSRQGDGNGGATHG
ncbi:hypothetical protein DL762_000786 [Monosporascus cannonballus]|uniref:Uncharacterized protein n=1 Tax=Monosporascus cannonballus TaxID=155416 RepID=A0ABY0HI94_9PEZI|nr:hypothetical protein DL762_000786 [Monosporascus cannonballus]RYO96395.1 hypothetical protein DL763_003251 [Monosporascus cannonballus]